MRHDARWLTTWILGALMTAAASIASVDQLSDAEVLAALYDWPTWARPTQVEPEGDWLIWLLRSGRGSGKTRTGAETVRAWVESGRCKRLHLVARTAADARDVMVEGESGLLAVSPPWCYPKYEPSKRRLTWPNGAVATLFAAEKPDALRGPQCDGWWADEVASWKYIQETWDNLMFGARLGKRVRGIVTTTPRPVGVIKDLVSQIASGEVVETREATAANVHNLAPSFVKRIYDKYGGTRLGRQELMGEILDDNPNALWQRDWIEAGRVTQAPDLVKIVVGVDPAVTDGEESAETGIIVAGKTRSDPEHFYVLADATVSRATPSAWGRAVVTAYNLHAGDLIVAETNNGGDMVISTIESMGRGVVTKKVTASRGKRTRAEPVSLLYEQGRVHHVGCFPELEDQCCEWEPGQDSPDRMDALVWAITELNDEKASWVGGGFDVSPMGV